MENQIESQADQPADQPQNNNQETTHSNETKLLENTLVSPYAGTATSSPKDRTASRK